MNVIRLLLVMMMGVGVSWTAVDGTPTVVTGPGPYAVGTSITIRVDFTSPVDVTAGISKIRLNLQRLNNDAYALATSTSTAVIAANFTYIVQSGDYVTNSNPYAGPNALSGVTNYNGTLLGALSSISVDTPLVVQNVTTTPSSGTLKIGGSTTFVVHLNRFALASGVTPKLKIATGAAGGVIVTGTPVGNILTSTLSIPYVVSEGDFSNDLDYLNTSSLDFSPGSLDGVPPLTLPAPGSSSSLVIDGIKPTISIAAPSVPQRTAPIPFAVTSSENITGLSASDFVKTNCTVALSGANSLYSASITPVSTITLTTTANAGATSIDVNDTAILIVNKMVFINGQSYLIQSVTSLTNFTVATGLATAANSGISVFPQTGIFVDISLPLNASIDAAGNGSLSAPSAPSQTVLYDPTPPIANFSAPISNTNSVDFSFTFTELAANILVNSGILVTNGAISSINTAANPTFTVKVTPTSPTVPVTLTILSGAVKDSAGNDCLSSAATFMPLAITKIEAAPTTPIWLRTGTLTITATLNRTVSFNAATGVPTLALQTGATPALATLTQPTGTTPANTLTFVYTIADGHKSNDLDVTSAAALNFNGRLLDGLSSLAVPYGSLTGSLASTSAVTIDTTNDGGATGPGKPGISDQPAGSGGCGAGSGIALILAGGWLGLGMSLRRRRAA